MRRTALIVAMVALLVCISPATALAWANGPAKYGVARDGYGSHDWILDQAIKQAGAEGAWVYRTAALRTTDDPDSRKTAATYHWFKDSGSCRGGPQMVSDLYHRIVVAYQAGDRATASRHLGVLSHYYTDIMQPFHATSASSAYLALHIKYEYAVDDLQGSPTRSLSWVIPRQREAVTDVRAKAVASSLYARSFFPSLLASYRKSRSVRSGTPLRVSRLVMNRAVNDLADVIASVPSAGDIARDPAIVDVRLSTSYPHADQRLATFVTVTDPAGRPLDAVGIDFVWRLPGGTVTLRSYTDANGKAHRYQALDGVPFGVNAAAEVYVTIDGVATHYVREYVRYR